MLYNHTDDVMCQMPAPARLVCFSLTCSALHKAIPTILNRPYCAQEAVHAGVGHMDRVMASGVFMTEAFQHLFICACLRMAALQEGQNPPSPIAIQQLTCHPGILLDSD